MKLHDNKLQWVFDQCEELQQAVCTLDLLHENIQVLPKAYEKIDELAHNKALSILLVLMGERIPKNYFTVNEIIGLLTSVTPQKPRKGEWLRMSDLSEQEDDRYECSRCGNVIHHKNKMNLYTFNSWCGRCGSDNGINI